MEKEFPTAEKRSGFMEVSYYEPSYEPSRGIVNWSSDAIR
jgi:hypothetical protein